MSEQVLNFGALLVTIHEGLDEVVYTFKGDVDEQFRQKDVPRIQKANVILNLEHINNFNSCGIREWVYLIRDLGKCGSLRFQRCSVTMIDQINMVPDSLGSGIVESFFAPYYCSCSVKEVIKLITIAEVSKALEQKNAPQFNCDNCGNALQFDALEESYFLFLDGDISEAS
jgi:hypothetical protein